MEDRKVRVVLFKPNGKFYTSEEWRIPNGAIGPHDMRWSPDFHTIDDGPVFVESQEPWGFPSLLMTYEVRHNDNASVFMPDYLRQGRPEP